jgi:hypothetical protein
MPTFPLQSLNSVQPLILLPTGVEFARDGYQEAHLLYVYRQGPDSALLACMGIFVLSIPTVGACMFLTCRWHDSCKTHKEGT